MTVSLVRGRRWGSIYGFRILDPASRATPIDYVGKTRIDVADRERQHRGLAPQRDGTFREQPWADLIVGSAVVLEQGWWTDAELDAREVAWIRHLLPRYNHEHNLANPNRIPIPVARRQRDARDAARGVMPRSWRRPGRAVRPVTPWRPGRRRVLRLRLRRSAAARRLAGWAVSAVALWVAAVVLTPFDAGASAVGSTLLAAVAAWPPKRRRRRRRRRR